MHPTVTSQTLTAMILVHFLCFTLFMYVCASQNATSVCGAVPMVHGSIPRAWRNYSCRTNARIFSTSVNKKDLFLLLLLCRDISLNPGPISFGFANCRSICNKGPLLADIIESNCLDMLAVAETHIMTNDTESFLASLSPAGYSL